MRVGVLISIRLAFLVALIASPSSAHISCGTKSKNREELDLMESKINDVKRTRGIYCKGCITIDTYVYVFRNSTGGGSRVDESVIAEQMQVLNNAFVDSAFQFRLVEANYEVDDFYYSTFLTKAEMEADSPLELMKKWPRRGGYSALNMYFGGVNFPYSFAVFPETGGLSKKPWDGVYIWLPSVPRVYSKDYLGGTAIHEVSGSGNLCRYINPFVDPAELYVCCHRWDTG